jgi:RNase P subunit RPR2
MNQTTEKWLCTECKGLLGFVEGKEVVRIKRKDVYVQVSGGTVDMNCYRCGKQNRLEFIPKFERKEE